MQFLYTDQPRGQVEIQGGLVMTREITAMMITFREVPGSSASCCEQAQSSVLEVMP